MRIQMQLSSSRNINQLIICFSLVNSIFHYNLFIYQFSIFLHEFYIKVYIFPITLIYDHSRQEKYFYCIQQFVDMLNVL